jgi:tetratricopeptide (TPR) repeat protein
LQSIINYFANSQIPFSALLLGFLLFCTMLSLAEARLLKRRFGNCFKQVFLLMFLLNVIFLSVGWIVSFLFTTLFYFYPSKAVLQETEEIHIEELSVKYPTVERLFSEGSLTDFFSQNYISHEKKMSALISMSEDISQESVKFIKSALLSDDDEIRLFSFSLISKLEQRINQKIVKLMAIYQDDNASDNMKLSASKYLALAYWELNYLDLVDEYIKDFLIKKSFFYVEKALELDRSLNKKQTDPFLYFLLGRMYLFKNEIDLAEKTLNLALELGYDYAAIMPYLAEIYYNKNKMSEVKKLYANLNSVSFNEKMLPIIAQWKEEI